MATIPSSNPAQMARDLLSIFARHWKLMSAVFIAVSLPIIVASMFKPVYYQASSKILVENNRRVNLELSSQLSEHAAKFSVPPERINSLVEIIKSRWLITELVKVLQLANTPEEELAETVRLQSQIDVKVIPQSTVIEITYTDSKPEIANRVVSTLAQMFETYYLEQLEGDNAVAFYKEQFDLVDRRLKADYTRLQEFRDSTGVQHGLAEEQKIIQDRIDSFNTQLANNILKIQELQARSSTLEQQLATQSKMIKSSVDTVPNPEVVILTQHLATLEIEKNSFLGKYTESSREVKDKIAEIAMTKARLRQLPPVSEGKSTMSVNPVYLELERELNMGHANMAGLKLAQTKILAEIDSNQESLAKLNSYAYDLTSLEHAVATNKKMHSYYLGKLDDAGFVDSMNRHSIGTISIVQSADQPLPTRKPLLLSFALALALGGMLAMGVVFLLEKLRPSLTSGEQVKDLLKVPVLATVSKS